MASSKRGAFLLLVLVIFYAFATASKEEIADPYEVDDIEPERPPTHHEAPPTYKLNQPVYRTRDGSHQGVNPGRHADLN
ncbi:hypothetical protein Scep_004677 [Stephania cephalantha]|uniref:Uncharacterized protein n=1 Tax=Stephania cephalantha TaxID=152367 RepID=A0AAP0KUA8_9MAGN